MSQLLAGAAQLDITPLVGTTMPTLFNPRTSVGIHDPLHAKALVLIAGDGLAAFCCCDLLCIPQVDVDAARAIVEERCGIPGSRILISATHTHTAAGPGGRFAFELEPGDYHKWLGQRIADAITMAHSRLRPAKIGYGVGALPEHVHNRRHFMKNGSVQMNPKRMDPDIVRPAGPTDPAITLMAVLDEGGSPIAAMGNYALHYVGGVGGQVFSADYYGEVQRRLNGLRGREFPVLWTNGCSGDINNIDFFSPPAKREPFEQIGIVAQAAAEEASRIWDGLAFDDLTALPSASEQFGAPLRRPSAGDLAAAKELYADKNASFNKEWVLAKEMVQANELPSPLPAEVQAFRIGDLAVVGLPGEIFCQHGLDIKSQSPFKHTVPIGLANAYIGYIPLPEDFARGGYETWLARSSCCAPEVGPMLVDKAVGLLRSL